MTMTDIQHLTEKHKKTAHILFAKYTVLICTKVQGSNLINFYWTKKRQRKVYELTPKGQKSDSLHHNTTTHCSSG